jgi:carbon starvation protein
MMNNSGKYLIWTLLSVIGAFALGYIALNRGEQINALWIVVAAVCVYLIAYRFYGLYIAKNVLAVDPTRMTPAVRHNDGLDYVPTDKSAVRSPFCGHCRRGAAGWSGAGGADGLSAGNDLDPRGVVLAGAVQDFMVLFVSTRRDGRSLGELVKEEMGPTAGVLALVACFMIMVIILAVLAMIVVKALTHSPWGTYTVAFTIPLAIFMGIYIRYLRPGRIGEVSVIGLVMLVFAIVSGGWVAESPTWAPWFDYTGVQLTWILVGYGFIAAVLPVWLLLAPRDYLSTFLKIGTIVGLAIGILIMRPTLTMPALTKFIDGTGPVWSAACSRSCLSPSPAARSPASMR